MPLSYKLYHSFNRPAPYKGAAFNLEQVGYVASYRHNFSNRAGLLAVYWTVC
jgi:hypothetical protein